MKLSVKTLQGVAFTIEAEPTDTVVAVKGKIQEAQSFSIEQQKLIHAGKVLKDESPLSEYGIKENDFLVVMVTKPKAPKPAAATPAAPAPANTPAAAAPAPTPAAAAPAAPAPSTSAASSSSASTPAAVSTPSAAPASTASAAASSAPAVQGGAVVVGEEMNATVQQLCEMGFPEDQVRAALQAAFNNPDRAVEYLMNGIPQRATNPPPSAGAADTAAPGGAAAASLEALRQHPQFDALRQLVQTNPAALPAVLQQIGGQSPELLRLINQNQAEFLRMLNEPIGTGSAPSAVAPDAGAGAPFDMGGMGGGMPSPQQIQQLLDSLSPEQQAQMAAQMGMTPEQLRGLSQMLSNLPPEAMEQMMASMGGAGGAGGAPPGATRIMLTEEEAAAVDRLCSMGFDRSEVVQAYLACDKNETLAANFLMDNMDNFGGGGGDDNDDIYG
ncbi:hypothetical protein Poli38472_008853 [Pythium oligandrum]|uniref:UV excision repair protein RAD23 n=1 Tax=Pythium oligandrum TaxID=41045 RepID=A0A8K1FAF9_PYTOL|nr:hypothetical protein Poli38472_008853 [Pythium oligandrum]|eukprot:TMW56205.1 hypothetical protein Poli38472_008853 [Pythium oligandrum]